MLPISTIISFLLWSIVCCDSYNLEPKFWTYKGHPIGYEVAHNHDSNQDVASSQTSSTQSVNNNDPILLLNGFGVGSFHQHRLIHHLLASPSISSLNNNPSSSSRMTMTMRMRMRTVYGIDYLGQGRSWPIACQDGDADCERGLIYSADTWTDQIISFIHEIILPNHKEMEDNDKPCKVHIVGNSVGGYLSVFIALKHPDLVSSITLLNATPVWGLNLPGWSGHLPAPFIPKKIGRYLFDTIRDLDTIENYLKAAYSNQSAFGETLINQIRACTEGSGGHAAFASILWSPPASFNNIIEKDFNALLSKLQCDVLLISGKDDPWCKPEFSKSMLISLNKRNLFQHRYIELSNVGHCPNHEAPQAVAHVLNRWLSCEAKDLANLTFEDTEESSVIIETQKGNGIVHEPWGDVGIREVSIEEAEKMNIFEKLTVQLVMT